MNKWISITAGLLMAMVSEAQIRSQNAAGYVQTTLHEGKWHLISVPFNAFGGGIVTAGDLFGEDLPLNSTIFLYDNDNNTYGSSEKLTFIGWLPGNINLSGQPFWLFIGDDGDPDPAEEFVAYLRGEVPDVKTLAVSSVMYNNGGDSAYNLLSYNYPVQKDWTDTSLAEDLEMAGSLGDTLFKYNPLIGYSDSTKLTFLGWLPQDIVLYPGDAFWLDTAQSGNWDETKPYSWP